MTTLMKIISDRMAEVAQRFYNFTFLEPLCDQIPVGGGGSNNVILLDDQGSRLVLDPQVS